MTQKTELGGASNSASVSVGCKSIPQFSGKSSDNGIHRDLPDPPPPKDEKGCPKTNRILDELLPDPDTGKSHEK